jgi:hypothetical protein
MHKQVTEYTLQQFMAAADITAPTWARWVAKGVAPIHVRSGRVIRIPRAFWDDWFTRLHHDRMRTGHAWLRHPLSKQAATAGEEAFGEAVAVAHDYVTILKLTSDFVAALHQQTKLTEEQLLALGQIVAHRLAMGEAGNEPETEEQFRHALQVVLSRSAA